MGVQCRIEVVPRCLMNKKRKKEKYTYSQTSRLLKKEELQLHHNHETILFLTVLLLYAELKTYYW
jgi:hypothetical protein